MAILIPDDEASSDSGSESSVRIRALRAAAELVAEHGHDKLNLRMIAASAQSGLASIYYHFASKEALFLQLALDGFAALRKAMQRAAEDRADIFRDVSSAYLGVAQENADLYRLMYDERMLANHEELRKAERDTLAYFESCVAADGRFPPEHSGNIACTLYTFGRGLSSLGASYPDRRVPEEEWHRLRSGLQYMLDRPSNSD